MINKIMAGIYIHIPFCIKRCDYCDFYKTTNMSFKDEFLKILRKEITLNTQFISAEEINTIYFGGGTPSVLAPDEVKNILDLIFSHVKNIHKITEITFELNPDDATENYLNELKETGVNRLSIGIQSFDPVLLKTLNRRHDAVQALDVVKKARNAGFYNISIDLMYGLPGLSMEIWEQTVEKAIKLNVEHISAYHLTYEPGTVFYKKLQKGIFKEMPEDESLQQFKMMIEKLKKAGYEHYEISNFSLPGKRSVHNSNYWDGKKYIGLGPSAHSFDGKKRWWNVSDINSYLKGEFVENEEVLTGKDRYNELVMLKLRTMGGVQVEELKRVGDEYFNFFSFSVEKHILSGNVKYEDGRYFITEEGIFISDYLISELFYE